MEGFCKNCGQAIMVEAKDQEQADEIATNQCPCESEDKMKSKLLENMNQLCGDKAYEFGFKPIETEQLVLVKNLCGMVFEEKISSAKLEIDDTVISIKGNGSHTKISRKRTQSYELKI